MQPVSSTCRARPGPAALWPCPLGQPRGNTVNLLRRLRCQSGGRARLQFPRLLPSSSASPLPPPLPEKPQVLCPPSLSDTSKPTLAGFPNCALDTKPHGAGLFTARSAWRGLQKDYLRKKCSQFVLTPLLVSDCRQQPKAENYKLAASSPGCKACSPSPLRPAFEQSQLRACRSLGGDSRSPLNAWGWQAPDSPRRP